MATSTPRRRASAAAAAAPVADTPVVDAPAPRTPPAKAAKKTAPAKAPATRRAAPEAKTAAAPKPVKAAKADAPADVASPAPAKASKTVKAPKGTGLPAAPVAKAPAGKAAAKKATAAPAKTAAAPTPQAATPAKVAKAAAPKKAKAGATAAVAAVAAPAPTEAAAPAAAPTPVKAGRASAKAAAPVADTAVAPAQSTAKSAKAAAGKAAAGKTTAAKTAQAGAKPASKAPSQPAAKAPAKKGAAPKARSAKPTSEAQVEAAPAAVPAAAPAPRAAKPPRRGAPPAAVEPAPAEAEAATTSDVAEATTPTALPQAPARDRDPREGRHQRGDRGGRGGRDDRGDRNRPGRGDARPERQARQDRPPQPEPQRRDDRRHDPRPDTPRAAPAPRPAPTGPAHSALSLVEADGARHIAWQPGHTCPPSLLDAAAARLDAQGHLDCDDDGALPMLLRGAADAGHRLAVDEAVWLHLAAHRDARHRLLALEAAYPAGPVSPALQQLLTVPLPAFQAEGALFAVVAGRALIADERGLGKTVQSIAAATLWRRHFGVRRVLVLCAAARRASWQRSWQRFAGTTLTMPAQVIEGGMHQRQAQWSVPAEVRIMGPEALDSDAAHLAHWAPELVIVDEPMQVPGWTTVSAPQALVITAGLVADDDVLRPDQHALLETIVDWLDVQRLGPLAALRRIRAVRDGALTLDEAEIDALDTGLSRVMLQRLRSEVEDQLPPRVHSERLVPLESPQRQAHDRLLGRIAQLLDCWQRSGWLSDADQWRLGTALRELPTACHRSDPADPASPLADATVGAMQAQLDDWAASGATRVTVVCAHAGDQAQLSQRLSSGPALQWVMADVQGAPAPDTELVLQVGVPWRPRRGNGSPRGQQWLYMVGQDSLEGGLFETLALRADAPRGPADGGGRAYLQGERLVEWLHLLRAAVTASAPVAAAAPAA